MNALGTGRSAVELVIAIVVGGVIGLGTGALSPWITLASLGVGVAVFFLLSRPEFALLLMIVGYATILDTDFIPYFGAGGVSLNILDLLLITLLGTVLVRRLLDRNYELRITSIGTAIGLFMLVAVASIVVGLIRGTTSFGLATTELRYISYYTTYFVVLYLVRDRRSLRILLVGGLSLGIVTAISMITQFIAGPSVPILAGRIENFAQDGAQVVGIARILPPGRYLVLASFITLTVIMSLTRLRMSLRGVLTVLAWLTLAVALLLTFNRNFWLSSSIAILIFLVLASAVERRRLGRMLSATIFGGVVLIFAVVAAAPGSKAANLAVSVSERMYSIVSPSTYTATNDQNLATSSLNFRAIELDFALPQTWPPSPLGLGLGAHYRPTLPALDWEFFDGRGYIHNGHVWILLKTGVLGYLALIGAMTLVFVRGIRARTLVSPELRGATIGIPLVVVAVLLSSLVDPIVTELTWTPLFGVLAGALDVMIGSTPQAGVSRTTVLSPRGTLATADATRATT